MRRFACFLAVCSLAAVPTLAAAVHISPRGLGQVLLFPYYTVRSTAAGNAYNTVFVITNMNSDTKVVRVRFRESQNGREVASVNLFLTPFDSWAVALGPANGGTRLAAFDQSCFASNPAIANGGIAFSNAGYSGANADGGDPSLDRTTEGYFEAIEMGVVQDPTVLAALKPVRVNDPTYLIVPDCATALAVPLVNSTGVSPPTGGLTGTVSIINVFDGTLYPYDATALDNFSQVATYALVTGAGPTMEDVNPKTSDVPNASGFVHSTWDPAKGAQPADPVTAILMQDQVLNYFVLNAATQSTTDWVVTMPTKPFYTDPMLTGSTNAILPFEASFATDGAPDYFGILPSILFYGDSGDSTFYDREGRYVVGTFDWGPNPPGPALYLTRTANILTSAPTGVSLFASTGGISFSGYPFPNGWSRLTPFQYSDSSVHQLVSTDVPPATYFGLPMIGFMANNYVNGTLVGPTGAVLSNYGATSPHKGLLRIQ